jgi:hypothetical protein
MACNALVGVVELVECIESGHPGADPDEVEYLWVLDKPRVFVLPLRYIGRPGLFMVSDEVVAAALEEAEHRRRRGGEATGRIDRRSGGGTHERV